MKPPAGTGGFMVMHPILAQLQQLDLNVLQVINLAPHTPVLDALAKAVHYATYRGPIYYPILIYYFLQKDRERRRLVMVGAVAGPITSLFVNGILKPLVQRPRPFQEPADVVLVTAAPPNWSFPSGQTAMTFAVASIFFFMPAKRWERWLAGSFAALVALDRLYTGHHYPSDVVGGAGIGTMVTWLTVRGWKRYWRGSRRRIS